MKNKYYTPSIEEFHVGFECEEFVSNKWKKLLITQFCDLDLIECEIEQDTNNVRVKYLDREDIESLGFVFLKSTSKTLIQYSLGTYLLYEIKNTNSIRIKEIIDVGETAILFHGTIKNKSELKRVLQQLGITQ